MAKLKPGAEYVYELIAGVTYAHEVGDTSKKAVVGYTYDPRTSDGRPLHDHIMDDKLWGDIRQAAITNTALRDELDRVKMFYYLSKNNGKDTKKNG